MFDVAGVDIIDVSAGQTSAQGKPVYGRMFQTPFSDRIRNELGIKTMAVGNIYEADHVNSILMAGRADLVCIGRPHLADPYWTLHAATGIGDRQEKWPLPYDPGRDQAWRLANRDIEMACKVLPKLMSLSQAAALASERKQQSNLPRLATKSQSLGVPKRRCLPKTCLIRSAM